MASEYSVNIRLNTEQVRADLKNIKKDIDKLGKVNIGSSQRAQRTEAKITKSKDAQKAAMVETRRIGDLVQKAADQGLKVDKARSAINKAALADGRSEFKLSKAQHKVALEELKTQRAITKEKAQQSRLTAKSLTSGPFVSTGIASSRFGSVGQAGSPRFIASRAGMMQGPAAPPYAPGMFGSSPIGGTRFMFGSPAQIAFSGGPSLPIGGSRSIFGSPAFNAAQGVGAPRVPIGGRADLVGSPANLLSIGKQNAMPVKGFESLVGSPAYYEAQNKEILRIAKMNTLPVKGMKHIVGSPAYLQDQAKQLKKLRGAPTGFTAAQYGPQQPMQGPMFPTGAAQPLNYVGDPRQGNLLPGPLGSRQTRARLSRTLARNRGPALQSAAISGAFPLLFGQGPIAAAGGAIGGGLGGAFGGQMGGFAGGLIGTAVVSGIQSFVNSIKELGSALDPVNGSASQAIQSLGFLNSARAKEIALIEKQLGKQSALAAVRQEMSDSLGAKQTLALQEAAEDISDFQKAVQKSMAQFKADVASFVADLVPGSTVQSGVINQGVLANPDLELVKRYQQNLSMSESILNRGLEARLAGFTAPTGFLGSGEGKITKTGKEELKRLKIERDIMEVELRTLGIQSRVNSLVEKTNQDFMLQLDSRQSVFDLETRVLELRAKGINPTIAKEMAMLEVMNKDTITGLQSQIKLRKDALEQITDPIKKQLLKDEIDGLEKGLVLLQDQNKERIEAVKRTMELNMKTDLVVSSAKQLKETLVTDIGEGIKGLIRGTSTLNDVLNNVLNKLIDAAFNMALFGNVGGSFLSGSGLLGSLFGGGSSGPVDVATPVLPTPIAVAANGGFIPGGRPSLVGEKGPELFTPAKGGFVTPNHALGGTTNIVVNVDASGSSVEGDEEQGRELGRIISAAIQSELIKQKRPGGMLA